MNFLIFVIVVALALCGAHIIHLASEAKVDTITVSQEMAGDPVCFSVKSGRPFSFRVARFKENDGVEDIEVLNTIEVVDVGGKGNGSWTRHETLPPNRQYFVFITFGDGEIIGRSFRLVGTKLEV